MVISVTIGYHYSMAAPSHAHVPKALFRLDSPHPPASSLIPSSASSFLSPSVSLSFQVVVMDGDIGHDWVSLFDGCTLSDGSRLRVVQASWKECAATVYQKADGQSGKPVLCIYSLIVCVHFLCIMVCH